MSPLAVVPALLEPAPLGWPHDGEKKTEFLECSGLLRGLVLQKAPLPDFLFLYLPPLPGHLAQSPQPLVTPRTESTSRCPRPSRVTGGPSLPSPRPTDTICLGEPR